MNEKGNLFNIDFNLHPKKMIQILASQNRSNHEIENKFKEEHIQIMNETVKIIGNKAFEGCEMLTNVDISSSLTYIDDKSFSKRSSLTHFFIPQSVKRIGDNSFESYNSLVSIAISQSTQQESIVICSKPEKIIYKDESDSLFILGTKSLNSDIKEAIKYMKNSSDKGNSSAMLFYGNMLYNGKVISDDQKEAAMYYKKTAEKGNAEAMFKYGKMLYKGIDIPVNKKEASKYIKDSADKGNSNAIENDSMNIDDKIVRSYNEQCDAINDVNKQFDNDDEEEEESCVDDDAIKGNIYFDPEDLYDNLYNAYTERNKKELYNNYDYFVELLHNKLKKYHKDFTFSDAVQIIFNFILNSYSKHIFFIMFCCIQKNDPSIKTIKSLYDNYEEISTNFENFINENKENLETIYEDTQNDEVDMDDFDENLIFEFTLNVIGLYIHYSYFEKEKQNNNERDLSNWNEYIDNDEDLYNQMRDNIESLIFEFYDENI